MCEGQGEGQHLDNTLVAPPSVRFGRGSQVEKGKKLGHREGTSGVDAMAFAIALVVCALVALRSGWPVPFYMPAAQHRQKGNQQRSCTLKAVHHWRFHCGGWGRGLRFAFCCQLHVTRLACSEMPIVPEREPAFASFLAPSNHRGRLHGTGHLCAQPRHGQPALLLRHLPHLLSLERGAGHQQRGCWGCLLAGWACTFSRSAPRLHLYRAL